MAELTDDDYRALAAFRLEIRRFLRFSEQAAKMEGLSASQYQALLCIRSATNSEVTIGYLANQLLITAHTASELVQRLEARGLIGKSADPTDKRVVRVWLSERALELLRTLASSHKEELQLRGKLLRKLLMQFD